ncbi:MULTISPECIES: dihydrofolate reductase family protein [Actinomycetes]|uniref:Dihydrofolate reductase family protein n=2 Tax=Actinomycetes TaxID=1760 RepID=A0ABP6LN93_9MICC
MTQFLYAATVTVDGRIAGADGDMSWLLPHMGPDPILDRLMPQIQALLVGRTTYDGDDPHAGDAEKEGAFEGSWSGPQVLLTHRPPATPPPGITVTTDLDVALSTCRAAAPDGIVSILGADVARQCLEAGAVDLVMVTTVPVMLGQGTPLLQGSTGQIDLDVVEESPRTRLFRVRRDGEPRDRSDS